LAGIQIAPGPLLAFDERFVATNLVDPEAGSIDFVFTLLRPAPPINGQGVLATVVFEIMGDGPLSVTVTKAQLVSAASESLPVTFEDLSLSVDLAAAARPPATTPARLSAASPLDWRWWGGLIFLAGALTLTFFILRRSSPGQSSSAAGLEATASFRTMPGAGRSSTRSATLLASQGRRLLAQGNMQAAYELFSRAVELDPASVDAWLGKGIVAQNETERKICLQRVLALDPDNIEAKKVLGQS
jgi:hypothetical protein